MPKPSVALSNAPMAAPAAIAENIYQEQAADEQAQKAPHPRHRDGPISTSCRRSFRAPCFGSGLLSDRHVRSRELGRSRPYNRRLARSDGTH